MTTIQASDTHHVFRTTLPDREPLSEGPIARIVASSVATGLVGALFLALVVFPGGAEHVITGSALLAFAAAWTMLAVLSARMTSQPQRWAFVPATYMGVVGTALLLLAPGDDALRTMGWVWPVPVLALAGWIAVSSRRQLHSKTRSWLLYPVVAFLALGAVGCTYETVQSSLDQNTDTMPGTAYDVGGRRLHLNCTGVGSPTVVLEAGLGEISPHWAWIAPAVAADTRVCAYDRAGQGWSDDSPGPHDGAAIAAHLHTLLQRANEPGPYVLVGHSIGGPYVMTYAQRYPGEVAGMVLLDATSPRAFTDLPSFSASNAAMVRFLALLPSVTRLGLGQLAGVGAGDGLPAPASDQAHAFATRTRDTRAAASRSSSSTGPRSPRPQS
jgi:pimeloyl-ACP methyl ester carboxylesterase